MAAIALAALMVSVGHPEKVAWWLASAIIFAFVFSPLGAAHQIAARTDRMELRAIMAFVAEAYLTFASLTFYSVFREPDATSGLAFMAVPAVGWVGLPVAVLASAVLIRFRRPSGGG